MGRGGRMERREATAEGARSTVRGARRCRRCAKAASTLPCAATASARRNAAPSRRRPRRTPAPPAHGVRREPRAPARRCTPPRGRGVSRLLGLRVRRGGLEAAEELRDSVLHLVEVLDARRVVDVEVVLLRSRGPRSRTAPRSRSDAARARSPPPRGAASRPSSGRRRRIAARRGGGAARPSAPAGGRGRGGRRGTLSWRLMKLLTFFVMSLSAALASRTSWSSRPSTWSQTSSASSSWGGGMARRAGLPNDRVLLKGCTIQRLELAMGRP